MSRRPLVEWGHVLFSRRWLGIAMVLAITTLMVFCP
jgi:hypothetical protein